MLDYVERKGISFPVNWMSVNFSRPARSSPFFSLRKAFSKLVRALHCSDYIRSNVIRFSLKCGARIRISKLFKLSLGSLQLRIGSIENGVSFGWWIWTIFGVDLEPFGARKSSKSPPLIFFRIKLTIWRRHLRCGKFAIRWVESGVLSRPKFVFQPEYQILQSWRFEQIKFNKFSEKANFQGWVEVSKINSYKLEDNFAKSNTENRLRSFPVMPAGLCELLMVIFKSKLFARLFRVKLRYWTLDYGSGRCHNDMTDETDEIMHESTFRK